MLGLLPLDFKAVLALVVVSPLLDLVGRLAGGARVAAEGADGVASNAAL